MGVRQASVTEPAIREMSKKQRFKGSAMTSNKRLLAGAMTGTLLIALSGHAQEREDAPVTREAVAVTTSVSDQFPRMAIAGKRVRIGFSSSPTLTSLFAKKLKGSVAVVAAGDPADIDIRISGLFSARRERGNRKAQGDIGTLVEKGGKVSAGDRQWSAALPSSLTTVYAADATGMVTLLEFAADVTGFRSWFNTLMAGDPDGVCFRGCEYQQGAQIVMEAVDSSGAPVGALTVTATAFDQRLSPDVLIDFALSAMLARLEHP